LRIPYEQNAELTKLAQCAIHQQPFGEAARLKEEVLAAQPLSIVTATPF